MTMKQKQCREEKSEERQENGGDDYNNDYKRYQLFWFCIIKSCKWKTERKL